MDVSHIMNADLGNVKDFFFSHYAPDSAIVCLAGSITPDHGFTLAEKWFGPVPWRNVKHRNLPSETAQESPRSLTVERDVPSDAIYKAWHIGPRLSNDFYAMDLLTDILAGGESGRLYTELVRGRNLFSEINAFLTSDIDPGLVIVTGKLMSGINIMDAENAVNEVVNNLIENEAPEEEMEKVKNKFESSTVLSNTSILNKALNLSFYELLGDPALINVEIEKFRSVSSAKVIEAAKKYLRPENCSTIYYLSSKKEQI
jgi:predicted Zn-dependent peptidase